MFSFSDVSFKGIIRLERISLLKYRSTLINTLIKNRATAKYKLTNIIIHLCISRRIYGFLRFKKRKNTIQTLKLKELKVSLSFQPLNMKFMD